MNLNRFQIGTRITIGVAIPLLLFTFVGVWSWIVNETMFNDVQNVRNERIRLTALAQRFEKDLVNLQYYLAEIAISKTEQGDTDIFSGAADYYQAFITGLDEYEEFYKRQNDEKVVKDIGVLRAKLGEFYTLGKQMAAAFVDHRMEEGFEKKEQFNEVKEYIDFYLEPLLRREREATLTAMDALIEKMSRLKQGVLTVLLVAMAFSITVSLLLVRSLVPPILTMKGAMQTVSQGNLNHQVPVIGQDELSDMARIFNQMAQDLAQTHSGLVSEKEKLSTIILSAREGIVVTGRQGNVVLVNPSAERLLGKTRSEIMENGFQNLVDDPEYILAHLHGGNPPDMIVYKERILSIYASAFYDDVKNLVGAAALIRDITSEKNLEEQLRRLSQTDALTGLYNRRKFDTSLNEELERATRYKQQMSMMLFDVDHFKKFNDTYGHDQGDRVLQAVGRQMKSTLRTLDICCRYGGEEFVAILPSTPAANALRSAERLRADIEAMVVDGLKVTISIGISSFPECGGELKADALIKLADNALYQAKKAGRNCVQMAELCRSNV
ncbi:MAG: diguanylate cyclase [Magnetococcales bacterium]|nr:diguanylate cyclase [Magnetococcales bacterium]